MVMNVVSRKTELKYILEKLKVWLLGHISILFSSQRAFFIQKCVAVGNEALRKCTLIAILFFHVEVNYDVEGFLRNTIR